MNSTVQLGIRMLTGTPRPFNTTAVGSLHDHNTDTNRPSTTVCNYDLFSMGQMRGALPSLHHSAVVRMCMLSERDGSKLRNEGSVPRTDP